MKLTKGQTMICKCGAEMDRVEHYKRINSRSPAVLHFVCVECGEVKNAKDFLLYLSKTT